MDKLVLVLEICVVVQAIGWVICLLERHQANKMNKRFSAIREQELKITIEDRKNFIQVKEAYERGYKDGQIGASKISQEEKTNATRFKTRKKLL